MSRGAKFFCGVFFRIGVGVLISGIVVAVRGVENPLAPIIMCVVGTIRRLWLAIFLVAACFILPSKQSCAAVPLVLSGEARAVIVVPQPQPRGTVNVAAEELVYHVQKASGVKLQVVSEEAVPQRPAGRVYLADCAATRQAGIDASKLPPEACVIKTKDNALFVAGMTLYGVYALLEEHLGVRWLWPGELGEFIPRTDRIVIADTDKTVEPHFVMREIRTSQDWHKGRPQEGRWLARHRRGSSVALYPKHAFRSWWQQYGDQHPRCNDQVRFVTEQEFEKLISVVAKPHHKLLLWLQWDVGENINTLLQLAKKDFVRQMNPDTKEPEYLVNLPRGKLKRSRQTRSEPTLYPDTARYLDMILEPMKDGDRLFNFGHRQALKVIQSACRQSGAKCMPHQDRITWKDLRSGMASHLLKSGWSRDEVNARLGHAPSSKSLNAYINYLAIDRHRPKKKLHTTNMEALQSELEEARQREKLLGDRLRRHADEQDLMGSQLKDTRHELLKLRKLVESVIRPSRATQPSTV